MAWGKLIPKEGKGESGTPSSSVWKLLTVSASTEHLLFTQAINTQPASQKQLSYQVTGVLLYRGSGLCPRARWQDS